MQIYWRLILAFIKLYSRLYGHCYSPALFSKTRISVALESLPILHSVHAKTHSPSSSKSLTLQKINSVSSPKHATYTAKSVLSTHTFTFTLLGQRVKPFPLPGCKHRSQG